MKLSTLTTDMSINEIDPGIAVILCYKLEIAHFSHTLNDSLYMDISLVHALICLNTSICIVQTCLEGSVSQNYDIGPSFVFVCKVCRREVIKYKLGPQQKV